MSPRVHYLMCVWHQTSNKEVTHKVGMMTVECKGNYHCQEYTGDLGYLILS